MVGEIRYYCWNVFKYYEVRFRVERLSRFCIDGSIIAVVFFFFSNYLRILYSIVALIITVVLKDVRVVGSFLLSERFSFVLQALDVITVVLLTLYGVDGCVVVVCKCEFILYTLFFVFLQIFSFASSLRRLR